MEVNPLSEKTGLALWLLAAAVLLGLLGDALLRSGPPGLNVGLWVATLVVMAGLAARAHRVSLRGEGRWLAIPMVVFALGFAWRDSAMLGLVDVVAILGCAVLAASYSRSGRAVTALIGDYVFAAIKTGLSVAFGIFLLVLQDVEWKVIPRGRWTGRVAAVGVGLAIAAPLLLLFGALFASADAAFGSILARLFDWKLDEVFWHLFWTAFWGVVAAGLLRKSLIGSSGDRLPDYRPSWISLGIVETSTALGALDLLFLAFVLVQFRYLFGGATLVEASVSLGYSDYARRGFFELVAVAAFALPTLLVADWLLRREKPSDERLFRVLAGFLVVMVFVVIASAVQRMRLYQDEFGQTELRLYTMAFMGWLALLFAWFLASILRRRRDQFGFGAVVAGLLVAVALNVLNPDAYIVATNVERARAGKEFDADYVSSLGAAAVPELLQALPGLPEQDRRLLARNLLDRWSGPPSSDFRTWNWDRDQAHRAVNREETMLREIPAPDPARQPKPRRPD